MSDIIEHEASELAGLKQRAERLAEHAAAPALRVFCQALGAEIDAMIEELEEVQA